jgi:hypothetical protein
MPQDAQILQRVCNGLALGVVIGTVAESEQPLLNGLFCRTKHRRQLSPVQFQQSRAIERLPMLAFCVHSEGRLQINRTCLRVSVVRQTK